MEKQYQAVVGLADGRIIKSSVTGTSEEMFPIAIRMCDSCNRNGLDAVAYGLKEVAV